MKQFRYLENVTTLMLDQEKCIGCGQCAIVCPHTVFKVEKSKAYIVDFDGCMECGACQFICPARLPLVEGLRRAKAAVTAWD